MIIILQALYFFRDSVLEILEKIISPYVRRRKSDDVKSFYPSDILRPSAEFNKSIGVVFSPPVYQQRYAAVCDILKDKRWEGRITKVADIGSSNGALLMYLKEVAGVDTVLAVDLDVEALQFVKRNEPARRDYTRRRRVPFKLVVLKGNAADPDYRMLGCDAVIGVELIEHMDPHDLERLPHTIFGTVRPWVVVLTTPNADFNVLFPSMKPNGFRHDDHRFEWTREQFNDWCSNIVVRYPSYSVVCEGIGPGPLGTEAVGCCSQMAVFVHSNYRKRPEWAPDNVAIFPDLDGDPQKEQVFDEKSIKDNVILKSPSLTSLKGVGTQSCLDLIINRDQPQKEPKVRLGKNSEVQCNLEEDKRKEYLMVDSDDREAMSSVKIARTIGLPMRTYTTEDVNRRLNCSEKQVKQFSLSSSQVMMRQQLDSGQLPTETMGEVLLNGFCGCSKVLADIEEGDICEECDHPVWNNNNWGDNAPYWNQFHELIAEIDYPYTPDLRSVSQRVLEDASERVHYCVRTMGHLYAAEDGVRLLIPLVDIMPFVKDHTEDVDYVREILEYNGYEIEGGCVVHGKDESEFSFLLESESDPCSDMDDQDYQVNEQDTAKYVTQEPFETWDLDSDIWSINNGSAGQELVTLQSRVHESSRLESIEKAMDDLKILAKRNARETHGSEKNKREIGRAIYELLTICRQKLTNEKDEIEDKKKENNTSSPTYPDLNSLSSLHVVRRPLLEEIDPSDNNIDNLSSLKMENPYIQRSYNKKTLNAEWHPIDYSHNDISKANKSIDMVSMVGLDKVKGYICQKDLSLKRSMDNKSFAGLDLSLHKYDVLDSENVDLEGMDYAKDSGIQEFLSCPKQALMQSEDICLGAENEVQCYSLFSHGNLSRSQDDVEHSASKIWHGMSQSRYQAPAISDQDCEASTSKGLGRRRASNTAMYQLPVWSSETSYDAERERRNSPCSSYNCGLDCSNQYYEYEDIYKPSTSKGISHASANIQCDSHMPNEFWENGPKLNYPITALGPGTLFIKDDYEQNNEQGKTNDDHIETTFELDETELRLDETDYEHLEEEYANTNCSAQLAQSMYQDDLNLYDHSYVGFRNEDLTNQDKQTLTNNEACNAISDQLIIDIILKDASNELTKQAIDNLPHNILPLQRHIVKCVVKRKELTLRRNLIHKSVWLKLFHRKSRSKERKKMRKKSIDLNSLRENKENVKMYQKLRKRVNRKTDIGSEDYSSTDTDDIERKDANKAIEFPLISLNLQNNKIGKVTNDLLDNIFDPELEMSDECDMRITDNFLNTIMENDPILGKEDDEESIYNNDRVITYSDEQSISENATNNSKVNNQDNDVHCLASQILGTIIGNCDSFRLVTECDSKDSNNCDHILPERKCSYLIEKREIIDKSLEGSQQNRNYIGSTIITDEMNVVNMDMPAYQPSHHRSESKLVKELGQNANVLDSEFPHNYNFENDNKPKHNFAISLKCDESNAQIERRIIIYENLNYNVSIIKDRTSIGANLTDCVVANENCESVEAKSSNCLEIEENTGKLFIENGSKSDDSNNPKATNDDTNFVNNLDGYDRSKIYTALSSSADCIQIVSFKCHSNNSSNSICKENNTDELENIPSILKKNNLSFTIIQDLQNPSCKMVTVDNSLSSSRIPIKCKSTMESNRKSSIAIIPQASDILDFPVQNVAFNNDFDAKSVHQSTTYLNEFNRIDYSGFSDSNVEYYPQNDDFSIGVDRLINVGEATSFLYINMLDQEKSEHNHMDLSGDPLIESPKSGELSTQNIKPPVRMDGKCDLFEARNLSDKLGIKVPSPAASQASLGPGSRSPGARAAPDSGGTSRDTNPVHIVKGFSHRQTASEEMYVSSGSSLVLNTVADDSVIPTWLRNIMENQDMNQMIPPPPPMPPRPLYGPAGAPAFTSLVGTPQGAGDGAGVHAEESTSSGNASSFMSTSTSGASHTPQIDPMESGSVTSEDFRTLLDSTDEYGTVVNSEDDGFVGLERSSLSHISADTFADAGNTIEGRVTIQADVNRTNAATTEENQEVRVEDLISSQSYMETGNKSRLKNNDTLNMSGAEADVSGSDTEGLEY